MSDILVWVIPIVGILLFILIYYRQPWYYVELSLLVISVTMVCEFLFGFGMLDSLLHPFNCCYDDFFFGNFTGNWTWGNLTLGNETIGNVTGAMP